MASRTPLRLHATTPIVDADGTMSQVFRSWAGRVTERMLYVGTGSPEGVLEAPQYSEYIDETTPAAPVKYVKMLPAIAGDRKQGWAAL